VAGFMDFLKNLTPEQGQFLLNMGAGMLSQPYTDRPQGALEPFGRGMLMGNDAYQNAMILKRAEDERQRLIKKEQVQELEQFGKEAQNKADFGKFMAGGPAGTSIADRQSLSSLFNIDPGSAISAAMALRKPAGPIVSAGDLGDEHQAALLSLYGPMATEPTADQNAAAMQLVQANREAQRAAGVTPVETPNQRFVNAAVDRDIKLIDDTLAKAPDIQALEETIGFTKQLSEAIDTGGLGEQTFTMLNSGLQNFGLPTLQTADETALREGLGAVQGRLINLMRAAAPADPQFSKADLEFYERQVPGLSTTPAGRKIAIQMAEAQSKRAMAAITYFHDAQSQGLDYETTMQGYRDMMKKMPVTRLLDSKGQPTEAGQDLVSTAAGHPPMLLNGKILRWDGTGYTE
jgi:hypothetical protein